MPLHAWEHNPCAHRNTSSIPANSYALSTFTTSGKIWKTACHINFQTAYVHMDTLQNSGKITITDGDFCRLPVFTETPVS